MAAALLLNCLALLATGESTHEFRVPEGFEVTRYADDALAHDIYSMTIDSLGRVVVAGAGYVKILHDTTGDGRADRATTFAEIPRSGAHGMYFDGADLICTGDNSVMRLVDIDGDGVADGPPQIWTRLKHPEHGANGLVRGPDGYYYLICGNDAGVSTEHAATATSPVKHPHSGAVVRFAPDGRVVDVVAHGFRNPYDLDFDASGRLFTVDSDGERDHHLPWYAPTRLFDIAQGQEHGWLLKGWTQSWNRPASFFDNVERAVEIGRGSPTGLVVYRHHQFPQRYQGGVFSACWTFGRVHFLSVQSSGASCTAICERFMETTGDVGFAPCDLAVGPEGDLFVAIGGRRTSGGVFRVHYRGKESPAGDAASSPLAAVLGAAQPLASWSRARWVPQARELGARRFSTAALDAGLPAQQRIRAIEILVELFGGLDYATAWRAARDTDERIRARTAWALGRDHVSPYKAQLLAALTDDDSPLVARFAWEALATMPRYEPSWPWQPAWSRGLSDVDRRVRAAAVSAARGSCRASYQSFASSVRIAGDAYRLRLSQYWIALPQVRLEIALHFDAESLPSLAEIAADDAIAADIRLDAVRLLQIGLGDVRLPEEGAEVYGGYASNALDLLPAADRISLAARLAPAFPTTDAELDRELARLLGMLHASDDALLERLAGKWDNASSVEDDIHYLIVASRLEGTRSATVTAATTRCLLSLHGKLARDGHFASRNWPHRVTETLDELCRRDEHLPAAIANSELLADPAHAIFVEHLPSGVYAAAVRRLWKAVLHADLDPTAEMVRLGGSLPADESAALLRPHWDAAGLRDAVSLVLARAPQAEDRERFVESLASPQSAVVESAAGALVALGMRCTPRELATAVRALKQACSLGKQMEPRITLMRLLEFWTEDGADVEWDPDPARLWVGWYEVLADYYPADAGLLQAAVGTDLVAWQQRLAEIDWTNGNPEAGRQVFELRACHRCHQASGHLGPELQGAVARMSREDLFTAMIDPNLEVSPAYQTTLIMTHNGQVHHGLVVYESPEGTLLQTGPDTTVRITNTDTASMQPSRMSLMPTGLLDPLSDQQLSDLYAYLKSLAKD